MPHSTTTSYQSFHAHEEYAQESEDEGETVLSTEFEEGCQRLIELKEQGFITVAEENQRKKLITQFMEYQQETDENEQQSINTMQILNTIRNMLCDCFEQCTL